MAQYSTGIPQHADVILSVLGVSKTAKSVFSLRSVAILRNVNITKDMGIVPIVSRVFVIIYPVEIRSAHPAPLLVHTKRGTIVRRVLVIIYPVEIRSVHPAPLLVHTKHV